MVARPEEKCDVLVIGGGNAALCAAMSAAEEGAAVTLVEHAPRDRRGGNSRHTRNLRVAHDKPTDVLTGAYGEQEYWDDLKRVTGGHTEEMLARLMIGQSQGVTAWMAAHGVVFQKALSGTLSLERTNAHFLGGGRALLNAYYLKAEQLGVRVIYEAEMRDLEIRGGLCTAAHMKLGGQDWVLRPGAVVAASGGFQANGDWMREAWGEVADNFIIRGTPYNTGRMLRVLLDKGADGIGDPTQGHMVAIDGRAPKYDGGIATRLDCVPYAVVVNREGQRFYDEGEDFWPKRYAIWGRLVAGQPGQVAYAVIDAKSERLFMPSLFPAEKAGTIAELAALSGLDPAALQQTIDGFNAACRAGAFDPGRLDGLSTAGLEVNKTNWARPIDTPPFSIYPLRPGITFTYLGVKVDEQARVVMQDGLAAHNLFAAGEIMAGNILGQGYLAGTGMTIGTVFGRLAGKKAAEYVQNQ
ncbi:MAG: tricarballylate dehydrogenase [Hyphomicrobiales bacterium]|nr:MAG: tricarballylate dehydrogenase [Hyphomicrobiales bacterium]